MTKPNPEHRIEICHKGETITVDYAGALNHARVHPEDIVPAFEDFPGPFPGQNTEKACSTETDTTTTTVPQSTITTMSPPATSVPPTTVRTTTTATSTTLLTTTTTTLTDSLTVDSLPETPTTTTGTSSQALPQPILARDMLPVTGANANGLLVASVTLVACGAFLVRRFK